MEQPSKGASPGSSGGPDGEAVNNQFELLAQRRFLPFFVTQFFGAFNDNIFKNALIIMIAFQGAELLDTDEDVLINVAAGLFILPFFLFSALAGQLIEKYEKGLSIRTIKIVEVLLMLAAAYGFLQGDIILLIVMLFFMGTQSTFFGPAKYSYIPQHLMVSELVEGNALVQMGTFVAILLGTMFGGILIAQDGGRELVAAAIVGIAVAGYLSSLFIPHTPALDDQLHVNWNIFSEIYRNISFMRSNRTVFLSVLGISWFWFLGATYLVQLPNYTRTTLGGNEEVVTMLLTLFTIGIGSGSLLCNWLSGSKIEIGLVPFGSIGLSLFGIDLFLSRPEQASTELVGLIAFMQAGNLRLVIDVVMIGFFGGLYIVPLMALVQHRSDQRHLSRIIAGNNILNALLMVLSAATAIVTLSSGMSIAELFLLTAVFNAVVALYIYSLVPEFFMRFIVWMLIHSIYHVRSRGLHNIPDEGARVLVCNHVSYVDALIIAGCIRRPVRFVMYYKIFNLPVLSFVFRTAGAIPIAGRFEDEALMNRAFDDIDAALQAGELVCIFPEGKLTADGKMNTFREGIERIIRRRAVPVIPMALDGLWGSVFSRRKTNILLRLLKGFKSTVHLRVGEVVEPAQVSAAGLQEKVQQLYRG